MKSVKKILITAVTAAIIFSFSNAYAASGSYISDKAGGVNIKYIEIDMNNKNIKPVVLNAYNQMNAADSLANMAKNAGAFAAINGTYFEAYNGIPVPWGTIIKDSKLLHIGNGPVAGITSSGRLLVDRLTYTFEGYVNGEFRAIPWRMNHPSTEPEAITIFTPEYGTVVKLQTDAKAVVVSNGHVSGILTYDFIVPDDGFAMVYNSSVAYLVDERFKIGDEVYYTAKIKTTYTNENDWNDVVCGLGAGPSLIINGVITADGPAEGFYEAKINTSRAARSFIGSRADGRIVIGNMGSATIKNAAELCSQMGLVNAMCLDGGGSVALYYPSANVSISGRNINNGLAFIDAVNIPVTAKPASSSVLVDGNNIEFDAYNINNNNFFKLRDLAMALNGSNKQFNVVWDNDRNVINLLSNSSYSKIGGELDATKLKNSKSAYLSNSIVYLNGNKVLLNAYNIDGSNYFKLRDIQELMDFNVSWDSSINTIIIDTNN